jgi:hypothetical protein
MLQYLLRKLFPQSRVLSSIPVTDMILLMQWFADKESRLSQANITSIKSENDYFTGVG